MIHERYNELLRKLALPYRPVAIKMCFEKPEVPRYDGPACAFCQFVKYVQDTGKSFYMQVEDDQCYGKLAMGMIDKMRLFGSDPRGLYELDREMAARVYSVPSPLAGE